jgi:hypothetical protein
MTQCESESVNDKRTLQLQFNLFGEFAPLEDEKARF